MRLLTVVLNGIKYFGIQNIKGVTKLLPKCFGVDGVKYIVPKCFCPKCEQNVKEKIIFVIENVEANIALGANARIYCTPGN